MDHDSPHTKQYRRLYPWHLPKTVMIAIRAEQRRIALVERRSQQKLTTIERVTHIWSVLRKNILPGTFRLGYRSLDGHASLWTKPIGSEYGAVVAGRRLLPDKSLLVSGFVSDKPNSGMELARALCEKADHDGITLVATAFGSRMRLYAALRFEDVGDDRVIRWPRSAEPTSDRVSNRNRPGEASGFGTGPVGKRALSQDDRPPPISRIRPAVPGDSAARTADRSTRETGLSASR